MGLYLGGSPAVLVSDLAALRHLLGRSHGACAGRPPIYPLNETKAGHDAPNLEGRGPGMLLSQGRTWSEQRRFVVRHLRDFGFARDSMEELISREVDDLCRVLEEEAAAEGAPSDLAGSMGISVVNSLWRIAVGERFRLDDPGVLRSGLPYTIS